MVIGSGVRVGVKSLIAGVLFSHAFSGELKAVSVVNEAVQDGVAEGGVSDNFVPMFDRDLAGNDGRGATCWRTLMIATEEPRPSLPARSLSNIGTKLSETPPSATPSWTASFTTLTAFNSPEKACENRTPAIKLLTPTQTPEPITMSVKAAAHDHAKSMLTIA